MKTLKTLITVLMIFFTVSCGAVSEEELEAFEEALSAATAEDANLEDMAQALLDLINEERVAAGLNELIPDDGLDEIMLWYGSDMVIDQHIGHEDINGRFANERVRYYSGQDDIRCSEITAWWNGASADSHYNAYKNSPGHHSAYMEEGAFYLGEETYVGIVVMRGNGPLDSAYENRGGTYSGLVFCDQSVDVEIDPFEE